MVVPYTVPSKHSWDSVGAPKVQIRGGTHTAASSEKAVRCHKHVMLTTSDILRKAITDAYEGWPMIFFAVQSSNYDVFSFLLETGTPVNAVAPPGLSLLAFVVLCPNNSKALEMTQLLLTRCADPRSIPIDVFRETGGACWRALRKKGAKRHKDLPQWWMAAPEAWLRNLRGRLTPAIRYVVRLWP